MSRVLQLAEERFRGLAGDPADNAHLMTEPNAVLLRVSEQVCATAPIGEAPVLVPIAEVQGL